MLYGITVNLTDSGFANIDKVLAAIFAYIKLLKRCGADGKMFAELQQIEATSFRYQTEKTALDNVEELCCNMHYYPDEHIISGSELYFEYDAQAIENVIGPLNSGKFNLIVTSSRPYQGVVYDRKEKWFGTEYATIGESF
jgi:nardilysin